ncbi:MAG: hypothetical protein P4L22_04885 [Candidatus Babeliales bacterium]|nr:hypothetical protein [Candidatus Babeliales bacterium]
MIKILSPILFINLFIFSFVQGNGQIDIALGTKNRMDNFKLVIENLNNTYNASDLCLYIMDGNEHTQVSDFLLKNTWHFKSIKIWKDANVEIIRKNPGKWAVIYDFLIRQGSSEFVTYWSDDILLFKPNIFVKAVYRLKSSPDSGVAIFNFQLNRYAKFGIVLNDIGVISLNFGIMKRQAYIKAGGLDSNFKFFRADNDLTNKIFLKAKYKTIVNNDCKVVCITSQWKNPFSEKKHYKEDMDLFEKKWGKITLKERKLRKNSISEVYPKNSKMSFLL